MGEFRISRLLSLLAAVGCSVIIVHRGLAARNEEIGSCFALVIPLVLIWFAEEFSELTGYWLGVPAITSATPTFLVSIMGWILLVAFTIALYVYWSC